MIANNMCEVCIRHNYPDTAERLIGHFNNEPERLDMMLNMSPNMAARYDTGDLDVSDPRIEVANIVTGRGFGKGDYSYQ